MKTFLIIAAAIVVGVLLLGNIAGVNQPIAAFCQTEPAEAQRIMQAQEASGLVKDIRPDSSGGLRIIVDDTKWAATPHDAKVSLGLAAFCQTMNANGRGTITIVGFLDGRRRAGVIDGNYSGQP